MFSLTPVGFVRSSLKHRIDAPRQGSEGALARSGFKSCRGNVELFLHGAAAPAKASPKPKKKGS
jgi:hypothetical protein